jgi:hypothetical protein
MLRYGRRLEKWDNTLQIRARLILAPEAVLMPVRLAPVLILPGSVVGTSSPIVSTICCVDACFTYLIASFPPKMYVS